MNELMNWSQAVEAMRRGCHVQLKSEQYQKVIQPGDEDLNEPVIYECGMEPCRLVVAWTDTDVPVRVFQGVGSKTMFEPEEVHTAATDWVIVWEPGK